MPRLLVIADDLTGASDTGVQFAKWGVPVLVATEFTGWRSALGSDYEVVAVNTESRHLDAKEAGQRVANVVAEAIKQGITHFYKKTDSSLRGNIGGELEALMKATGHGTLPFIPAFPKLNRTTRNGFQYVNEKLLHQSVCGIDPLEPLSESFVPRIIQKQTIVLTRELVLAGGPFIDRVTGGIYVIDAASDLDLRTAGEVLRENDLLKVTAGSAGFAEFLPVLLGFAQREAKCLQEPGRMLVVSGSPNEVSMRQIANASAERFAAVTLPQGVLLGTAGSDSAECREVIARILELGQRQRHIIVRSTESPEDLQDTLESGRKRGLDSRLLHQLVSRNIGQLTGQILEQNDFSLLSVFGGDTLAGVARARGWEGLLPQQEVFPGVVVSRVARHKDAPLLITKSGGFGPPDLLTQILERLGSR